MSKGTFQRLLYIFEMMNQLLRRIHRYYYLFAVGLFFLPLYPLIRWAAKPPFRFDLLNRLRYIFSKFSSYFAGMPFRIRFESEIDWSQNYVICANHTSNLDIPALIFLLKENYVFMGKDELLTNLVTGVYFRTIDIPLNRASKMSSYRAFKRAGDELNKGRHLVIFPEGMIGEDYPPRIQPFKNGPFRLAIEHNVPILPVTLENNWKRMWDDGHRYGSSPGICDICVHRPIYTRGMSNEDADDLRDKVFKVISDRFRRVN